MRSATKRSSAGRTITLGILALGLATAAAPPAATAQEQAEAEAQAPMEFERYQLVLLLRPAQRAELPEERVEEIQRAHIAHLERMWREGHLVIAGPFGDQRDERLRGLALYKVADVEEARRLASADPAVVAGRLEVEVVTWYVEEGYMEFPKSPPPPAEGADPEAAPETDGR
jgi:hypothetical protein